MNQKFPYLIEFLKFYQQDRGAPKSTLDAYEAGVKKFLQFMLDNYGYNDPRRCEKTHFYKFKEFLVTASYASNSIILWINAVKIYMAYLNEMNLIDGSKFPPISVAGGAASIPHYVPTVAEVFRIRMRRKIRHGLALRKATCFELLMSTGMRSDEMRALRACDFKFGDKPIDCDTAAPSIYFTGSIHLQPRLHRGKTKGSRKLYFSALTERLLRRYFDFYKMGLNSNVPFHPWARQNIGDWMRELGEGVVSPFNSDEEAEAGKVINRDFSYRDINTEELEIDPRMRELIKSRQDAANALPEFKQAAMTPERTKRRNLHPHSLRHFWMCATHYRNAFGERRSEDRLRIMAGHAYSATTFGYLRDLDLIKMDDVWKRLWLGKITDWAGIIDD